MEQLDAENLKIIRNSGMIIPKISNYVYVDDLYVESKLHTFTLSDLTKIREVKFQLLEQFHPIYMDTSP